MENYHIEVFLTPLKACPLLPTCPLISLISCSLFSNVLLSFFVADVLCMPLCGGCGSVCLFVANVLCVPLCGLTRFAMPDLRLRALLTALHTSAARYRLRIARGGLSNVAAFVFCDFSQ